MPGLNLQTCRERMLYLLQGTYGMDASARWTDGLLFSALDRAEFRIQERLPSASISPLETLSLVYGTGCYRSANVTAGSEVEMVALLSSSGVYQLLSRLSLDDFRDTYLVEPPDAGTPVHWCANPTAGRIYIGPTPDASLSNGLKIYSRVSQRPMQRLRSSFDISGVVGFAGVYGEDTVAIVLDDEGALSSQLGVNATAFPDLIQAGDEIAVWPVADTVAGASAQELSALVAESPRLWYGVASVYDELSGSLIRRLSLLNNYVGDSTDAFSGAVTNALPFMVAQVPGVLRSYPILMDAFCKLACSYLLDMDAPQLASQWRMEADQSILYDARLREGAGGFIRRKPYGTMLNNIVDRRW